MLTLEQSYSINKEGLIQTDPNGSMHIIVEISNKKLISYTSYGEDGYGEGSPVEYCFETFVSQVLANLGSIDCDDIVTINRNDTNYLFVSKFLESAHITFNRCYRSGGVSKKKK